MRPSGFSTFVLNAGQFLVWPNIQSILLIVPQRTSFRGSPQINHLLSHCLPDSQPFVLNSGPWLDSRFSSLDFDRLHVSRPLLDSRLYCSTPDCNSSFDSRLSACNSELIKTSLIHGFRYCSLEPWSLHLVHLHHRVLVFGQYNFLGAHLPVPSSFNLPLWRSKLRDYDDYAVCAFLEFGWPIGLHYTSSLSTDQFSRNHKGATDFLSAVDSYLSLELERGAVIGPFSSNPFSHLIVISPLNSVPKPQSFERRMILELSLPSGTSINDAIPDQVYLLLPGISRQHPYSWAIWDFLVRCSDGSMVQSPSA